MATTMINCHCGSVKIRLTGEPVAQLYCHCHDCQRISGGAYVPYAAFPSDAVEVLEGKTFTWALKTNPRTRCANCGTLLFGQPVGMGVRGIVGHLMPAGSFNAQFHINCQEAMNPVVDKLPHFKGFPAAFGGSDDQVAW
jgi:hypothetical protein